jgi:protein disulfide-isomerase
MMTKNLFASILILFFVLISCVQASQESSLKDMQISWHKSGMPEALELAKEQNRPLFVYWGAVWCPPCNVVKSTLFKDPKFIQATRDYISVYLDGDTKQAQKWGEELKTMGYPTLMILSPEGKEVLRLSPSNSVDDLVSSMNYTSNVWNPISEVLTQVLLEPDVNAEKVRSLAIYSWSQDKEVTEKPEEYAEKLFQLEEKIKNSILTRERAQFFMTALSFKLESLKEKQKLKNQLQIKYKTRVEDILNNPELLKANILYLAYDAKKLVSHLTEDAKTGQSKERLDFIELYIQKMRAFRKLKYTSYNNYYTTFYPSIVFAENFGVKADEKDKNQLIEYTTRNLAVTKDRKTREVMIDRTSFMLFEFGMKDIARKMLTTALKTTPNPFYLMSTLGYIEKEEGNNQQALEWYKKAYETAKGSATKLQWYSSYVKNLIELNPDDQAIKSHVNTLLMDYTHMNDSFWGRNNRVLVSLKKSVNKWAEEKREISWLKAIQTQGLNKCSASKKEIFKTGCAKFYKEFI